MNSFKIYTSYKALFLQLNAFEVKKLMKLMLDYVDFGIVGKCRSRRLKTSFETLRRLHDNEIQKEKKQKQNAGLIGARKRWKGNIKKKNSSAMNKNSSAIKENGTAIKKYSSAINKNSSVIKG